jgi:hypothetical protein
MLVLANKYIPSTNKGLKKQKPIADTAAGDNAYYITKSLAPKRKKKKIYVGDSEDDDDSEDEEIDFVEDDFDHDKPQRSFTGSEWRPCFNDRLTMFIAGTPGAGKSYLAKQMINLLPPDLPILLFTALEEKDGNFDELGADRLFKIKMTPETLSKIKLSEIRERSGKPQTILLFDDVDKIRDSKVQNATFAIMNDALANGRGHEKHDGKGDVHVICTSHSANDYQKTKYTFENSNYVALFPGTTPPLQMYRMFDKLGLEKDLCQQMIKLARQQKIRSIIIHKVVPMYMIFGNKIMLL